MGGFSSRQIRKAPGGATPTTIGDGCDLDLRLDLVGIRTEISSRLAVGDDLLVRLVEKEATRSVVCVTTGGEVVGTLAAFRGLAQLIACIEEGANYLAEIEFASPTRCAVRVLRR